MENETTRKVGSIVVAVMFLATLAIGAAPSVQAEEGLTAGGGQDGQACIKIYTNPPDVSIAAQDCELPPNSNETGEILA